MFVNIPCSQERSLENNLQGTSPHPYNPYNRGNVALITANLQLIIFYFHRPVKKTTYLFLLTLIFLVRGKNPDLPKIEIPYFLIPKSDIHCVFL